jgi:hypothetical protein
MYIIKHRVNTKKDLLNLNIDWGAEIDVRYHNDDLILHHDPLNHHKEHIFTLNEFLKDWKSKGPLILNIKTEGIELKCIQMIQDKLIKNNWFFLDLSMPYFIKYARQAKNKIFKNFGINNLAVRFSDKEPIEYALSFNSYVRWVWVDFFDKFPLNIENYNLLKKNNFKICLVSPELQNHPKEKIIEMKKDIKNMKIDAVCTKFPALWM